jgi:hypothetical protein
VHRSLRRVTGLVLPLTVWIALAPSPLPGPGSAVAGERVRPTVKARLTGWVGRRDGFYLYRRGATVRTVVTVRPKLQGERVRARLEWRRPSARWRLLDVSTATLNRDGRALFLVRRLPEGFAFRIRARMPPTDEHRAGRSPWRYFRVR